MTRSDNDLNDFRLEAIAASEALLRTLPSGLSLEKRGVSYCLARRPSLSRLRAPIKLTAVACAILGLSGVASGGIIGFLKKSDMFADNLSWLAIALCCSVGGVLLLFLPTLVERWIVRRHLCRHDEDYGSGSEHQGIHVALEYAPTYGSMKLLAEDVGLLYIYPEAHYVKIDGLSYEYVIQSKDVVGFSLHSNAKSVVLSYTVGEERLDLVIAPRSILAEFERQTTGSSRSLFVKMQDALEPAEGPD
jgi:hypothetical protein